MHETGDGGSIFAPTATDDLSELAKSGKHRSKNKRGRNRGSLRANDIKRSIT